MARLLWRAMFSDELSDDVCRDLCDSVREAMVVVMTPNVSDLFPVLAAADLQGVRRRMAALIRKAYQLMDGQIERRMQAHEFGVGDTGSSDFLDAMLDSMSQQGDGSGVSINRDVIRAFCTVSNTKHGERRDIHGHSGQEFDCFLIVNCNSRIYSSLASTQAPIQLSGLWQNYSRIQKP